MSRSKRLAFMLGIVPGLVGVLGCPEEGDLVVLERPIDTGAVISNPLPTVLTARRTGSSTDVILAAESAVETNLVYVSLAAGTYPTGATVIITSPRAPGSITASMVNGGLDPVPVPAIAGDTLDLEIRSANGVTLASPRYKVPGARRPRVVRTVPPRGKTDVAVNASIIIVFSEPVSSTTVTPATLTVIGNGVQVAGTVRLLPGNGTVAAFTPNAPLRTNTTYSLVVRAAIADVEGELLESEVSVPFTTGESFTGPPDSIRVSPEAAYIPEIPIQLTATVLDTRGNELIDQPVVWESSDRAGLSVSSTGLVTPLAPGNYVVTARIGNIVGAAMVSVRGPPSSMSMVPATTVVPVDEAIVLSTIVRDRAGFALNAAVTWTNSAPAVASVVSIPVGAMVATVTGMSAGTTTITATSGLFSSSASLTVTPRRAVASVSVSPVSTILIVGEAKVLAASLMDASGNPISNRPIAWAIDNPAVATVGANGQLTAVSAGTARATATSEGISGSAAITVMTLSFASISAGDLHTCGLTVEGATYCWGALLSFEIGINARTSRPVAVPGGMEVASVFAGAFHTCGLTSGGTAYCWGSGTNGQLGDGTDVSRATPAPVAGGLTFSSLTAAYHTCGLTTGGEAYCWGRNVFGELGDGSNTRRVLPTRVLGGLTFSALSAGSYDHTCGLTPAGEAYCWGRNDQGELGNGSTQNSAVPFPVRSPPAFASITAGGYHTCGLTATGNAYCWGAIFTLGNANGQPSTLPRAVEGGLTFTALSAGIEHTCGLVIDGSLYCWGRNGDGQIGDGTTTDRFLPTRVSGAIAFSSVSAGGWHTCAQSTDGILYCWGLNTVGELGIGSFTTNTPIPTKVVGQP